mmetsp:Transcript_11176/g.37251  ORF Transcript_11176/g.37251 Transcript_11176/m.37251 type:complete len:221 (-) Transcript_11176:411-1073(-)
MQIRVNEIVAYHHLKVCQSAPLRQSGSVLRPHKVHDGEAGDVFFAEQVLGRAVKVGRKRENLGRVDLQLRRKQSGDGAQLVQVARLVAQIQLRAHLGVEARQRRRRVEMLRRGREPLYKGAGLCNEYHVRRHVLDAVRVEDLDDDLFAVAPSFTEVDLGNTARAHDLMQSHVLPPVRAESFREDAVRVRQSVRRDVVVEGLESVRHGLGEEVVPRRRPLA